MTDLTFKEKTPQEKEIEAARRMVVNPFERIAQLEREEDAVKASPAPTAMGMPSALHQGLIEFHDIWCELHSLDGDKRSADYKEKAQSIAERLVAKHHEIVGLPH